MIDLLLLFKGFGTVLSGYNAIALFLGSFFGIIIGAIPGLTATMGIALLVPFTFGMTPITGIVMLLGIYTGGNLRWGNRLNPDQNPWNTSSHGHDL